MVVAPIKLLFYRAAIGYVLQQQRLLDILGWCRGLHAQELLSVYVSST